MREAAVDISGVRSGWLARESGLSAFSRQQRDQPAAFAVEAAGEFEFEQGGPHGGGRTSGQAYEIVDGHRESAARIASYELASIRQDIGNDTEYLGATAPDVE